MCVVEQDGIEAAGAIEVVVLQVILGGAYQFLLLALVYAVCGTGEAVVAAQAYFNKHQCLAFAHNQVNFAIATTIVLRQQGQSLLL